MYYLYYSVSSFGSQNSAIGLARSKTMETGTWIDEGGVGITSDSSKQYNAIDPNLVKNKGQYYLNFGSAWGGIHQVQMNSDPTKHSGEYGPATVGIYVHTSLPTGTTTISFSRKVLAAVWTRTNRPRARSTVSSCAGQNT